MASARRKCMLKNCPFVLMRFLMQIGHDTWLWPLDVFQCIISFIHSPKHCVYINLGMEGVIQANQEQQWARDSGAEWLLHSETHAKSSLCVFIIPFPPGGLLKGTKPRPSNWGLNVMVIYFGLSNNYLKPCIVHKMDRINLSSRPVRMIN